ncbi:unnamed protein product [Ceutorhynchus assimilis]|uniref:ubiquitinyl hydrolase 1 n=1 Tax=Ceutorhynchus assimilis TaxID=467358 RepID=A0A9N9MT09_9CUCU|nr:unnamed protein product [Ceutorhynchus assimilis]
MEGITELHIANNIKDLNKLAYPEKLGKNPKSLEKAMKNLYQEIIRETSDQEKCYIHCLRYLYCINTLCRIADGNYVNAIYAHEIARVSDRLEELRPELLKRYQLEQLSVKKAVSNKKIFNKDLELKLNVTKKLFPDKSISVKDLFEAIHENANILIVDIRPANEYAESKIKFENIINISEELIGAGLSANVLGQKLKDETQKLWDKRDTFDAIVFLDWNSNCDNMTFSKLKYIIDSVVEWDLLRSYKQHPVVLNGGFKEFLDSYPGTVTNVHINFIRNNEDIDELLELDSISYPEPDQNVPIMPLKMHSIEELEESTSMESDKDVDDDTSEAPILPQFNKDEFAADVDDKPFISEIRRTIEEEKNRLLLEAREKKKKELISYDNKNTIFEEHEDKPEVPAKSIPPPIRRETKPKKSETPTAGYCGLKNIRNTCYMNTVLQCLKCIPIIRRMMHSDLSNRITRRDPRIITEFVKVIQSLCEGAENDRKVFRPTAFYEAVSRLDPLYSKGNHEDCMEFFIFLFNQLHDDCAFDLRRQTGVMLERTKSWYTHLQGRTSFWVDLFYHQFKCTKTCLVCKATVDSYETDNSFMLPVPHDPGVRSVQLKHLISNYLQDNQILDYKCSKCKNLGVINTKEITLAPEILVLILKRYFRDEYQEIKKNSVPVEFDFQFKFGNSLYKLFSIAEHKGTMNHGHYIAHGLIDKSTWVEFNDERATKYYGDWSDVSEHACAFFYCKDKS